MPAKTYGTSLEWRARRVAFRGLPSTDRSHKKKKKESRPKKTTDKIEARPASLKRNLFGCSRPTAHYQTTDPIADYLAILRNSFPK